MADSPVSDPEKHAYNEKKTAYDAETPVYQAEGLAEEDTNEFGETKDLK